MKSFNNFFLPKGCSNRKKEKQQRCCFTIVVKNFVLLMRTLFNHLVFGLAPPVFVSS